MTVVSGHNVTSKYDKDLHTYLYYGADRLGEDFAVENNLQIKFFLQIGNVMEKQRDQLETNKWQILLKAY